MSGIGETFKKTRESKNFSLEEVSKATKIHIKVLKALEEEEFDSLPGALYTKGFIKKYCEFLGLESAGILNQYTILVPQVPPQILNIASKEKVFTGIKIITFIRFAGIIAGLCILLVLFNAMIHGAGKKKNSARVETKIKKPSTNRINKTPVVLQPKSHDQALTKNEGLALRISARKDTWLEVKSDGEVVFQHILQGGTEESWKAKDNFELSISESANVVLYVNGRKMASLGSGVKRGVVINNKGINAVP